MPLVLPDAPGSQDLTPIGAIEYQDSPDYWRKLAREAAQRHGLDPARFETQINQESGFSPDVVKGRRKSSAGASGIAQFMPGTAKSLGIDPLNVPEALDAAARYVATNRDYFHGDERAAFAAYNAGPGTVGELKNQYGAGWERYLSAETKQYLGVLFGEVSPTRNAETAPQEPDRQPPAGEPQADPNAPETPQDKRRRAYQQLQQQTPDIGRFISEEGFVNPQTSRIPIYSDAAEKASKRLGSLTESVIAPARAEAAPAAPAPAPEPAWPLPQIAQALEAGDVVPLATANVAVGLAEFLGLDPVLLGKALTKDPAAKMAALRLARSAAGAGGAADTDAQLVRQAAARETAAQESAARSDLNVTSFMTEVTSPGFEGGAPPSDLGTIAIRNELAAKPELWPSQVSEQQKRRDAYNKAVADNPELAKFLGPDGNVKLNSIFEPLYEWGRQQAPQLGEAGANLARGPFSEDSKIGGALAAAGRFVGESLLPTDDLQMVLTVAGAVGLDPLVMAGAAAKDALVKAAVLRTARNMFVDNPEALGIVDKLAKKVAGTRSRRLMVGGGAPTPEEDVAFLRAEAKKAAESAGFEPLPGQMSLMPEVVPAPPNPLTAPEARLAAQGRGAGAAGATGAVPDDVAGALDGMVPGETIPDTLLRQYGGGVRAVGVEAQQAARLGRQQLDAMGLEPGRHTPEIESLYKALHGEGEVPDGLEGVFSDLKALLKAEEAASLSFDSRFSLHPSYFPRFWRAPEATRAGPGRVGTTPGFKKPRVDATFSELIADGWEPASWNPYDMVALRRIAGGQYREQQTLIGKLKANELALPVDGPLPEGWSIPRVGPAFEGRPFATKEGQVAFSKPFAVPNNVAEVLENMFGDSVDWGSVRGVDIYKTLRSASNAAKRVKLMGSLFQQIDFAARTSFSSFAGAVDELIAGKPLEAVKAVVKMPRALGRLALANVSETRRNLIQEQLLDITPLLKERPGLTMRAIVEEGLSTRDPSMFVKDLRESVAGDLNPDAYLGITGSVRQRINGLNKAMGDGLFEGVYPQAQLEAIRNFVVPSLARSHPDWTDQQLAAAVAKEANKMFSSMPFEQSALRHLNKNLSGLTRLLVFSTNEPEALIKQAFSTIAGPNQKMWGEYYLGGALFLGAVANTVHWLTTGEPLPFDRYMPVKKSDFSPLGVTYNPDFFSPDIPIKGRGGTNLKLDLIMQMDTALRLLDPSAFLRSRENVIPRAIETQATGKDFFGRPLEGALERGAQAALDVLPIPAQNLAGIFRAEYGDRLGIEALQAAIPEGESRLGVAGQALQIGGLNLRAEGNAELRDRIAQEKFDGRKWGELTRTEQDSLVADSQAGAELDRRRATMRESGQGEPGVQFEAVKAKYDAQEQEAIGHFQAGTLDQTLPEKWAEIGIGRRAENERVEAIYKTELAGIPKDRIRSITEPYYGIRVDMVGQAGIDWDATYAARQDYIDGLSDRKQGKAPSDKEIMEDYLVYVEGRKTKERQDYNKYIDAKKAAGYFREDLTPAERTALDVANPDLDLQSWYWGGGVKDSTTTPVLNSVKAAELALARQLPNREVKLQGLSRPLNQTPEVQKAWEYSSKPVTWYLFDVVEQGKAQEQARLARQNPAYRVPWEQLTAAQKGAIAGNIHDAARKASPELDAWLYWWGATDKVLTAPAVTLASAIMKRYGSQAPKKKAA